MGSQPHEPSEAVEEERNQQHDGSSQTQPTTESPTQHSHNTETKNDVENEENKTTEAAELAGIGAQFGGNTASTYTRSGGARDTPMEGWEQDYDDKPAGYSAGEELETGPSEEENGGGGK